MISRTMLIHVHTQELSRYGDPGDECLLCVTAEAHNLAMRILLVDENGLFSCEHSDPLFEVATKWSNSSCTVLNTTTNSTSVV